MMTLFRHSIAPRGLALGSLALVALASCGNDFDPVSKVNSVRILAARAEPPYARPGAAVQLEMLAVDARPARPAPMQLSWVPVPCINPPAGIAEACYPMLEALFPRGVDLTPVLAPGPTFAAQIPADALAQSSNAQSGTPFAPVFFFSMACAGHVEFIGIQPSRPQASPFACVDDQGNKLGPGDFVFAFSRVSVFADRTNANPVVEGILAAGAPVDPAAGLVVDRCSSPGKSGDDPTCPTLALDVRVPDASHELDPSFLDDSGNPRREHLWVDYYATGGRLLNDLRIVFDPIAGRADSSSPFEAPSAAGDATLWAVVHDNRGGVAWTSIPIHTR